MFSYHNDSIPSSPWIKFDNIDWVKFDSKNILKSFSPKKIIYTQNQCSDNVYIIKKGRVRLSIFSEDGNEQHLTIAEEGCMFGELTCLDGLPNFATATVIVKSEIYTIPNDTFKKMMKDDESISDMVAKSLVRKIRTLSSQIESLSFKSAYARVSSYMLELIHSHGIYENGKYRLNIKFTQQEMADLTCLSRVSVSQIMNNMLEKKIIAKVDGYIIINSIDELRKLI